MKSIYALLFTAFFLSTAAHAQVNAQKTVQTKNGPLTRLTNLIDLAADDDNESLRKVQFGGKKYLLLQFTRMPANNERQSLAAQGVKLYDYLPGNAFLAELPQQLPLSALRQYKVYGVYEMDPSLKISPKLNNYTVTPDKYIAVSFYGDIDRATVINTLKQNGARIVEPKIRPRNVVFIQADAATVQKIAALPFVSYISKQTVKDAPLNSNNRAAHSISALNNPLGRNLQGNGVVIGVGDQGDPSTHLDFSGRLINRNPMPPTNHGTHTTGTTGGAGLIEPRYRGMAPRSTLIHQFYSDILVNTPLFINEYGMVLTNNSYYSAEEECPGNGDYDVLSNYIDDQLLAHPELLHVFASGNDGDIQCLPYPFGKGTIKSGFQTAKNTLTVGNISTVSYVIYGSSSQGPVYDGRLKPEIVAGGDGVWSTRTNNVYNQSWGTSMSSPTVTGGLALVYERYRQLNGGANIPAALLKAAAVNGADDWGNAGPDFTYGFGIFNARNTVETIEQNRYVLNSVSTGNTVNFNITGVPAGTHQLKVLLYWPDAPASPNAPTALVNNLNLVVTDPGNVDHLPLILDPSIPNLNNPAVPGVDNLNNIEQVVIDNPPAGNFTVKVTGANVPSGTQNYVVVYQVINPGVTIEHPRGGEIFVPGEFEAIRFNAYGGGNNTFTAEYSTNGGSTWTVINNNIPATSRNLFWAVPNLPTSTARVRVTRNVSGLTDISPQDFTIMTRHSTSPASLTVSNPCPGYIQLNWAPIPSATSYEVVMFRNNTMTVMGTTNLLTFTIPGLSRDSTYYVAVTPLMGATRGRQCFARNLIPNAGGCTLTAFDNDLAADLVSAPLSGRMFTSSQRGIETLQLRIRNLDNVATSGSYNISYQVNGGGIVTESSSAVINALSTSIYSFTQTYDFSATGTYTIKMWVDRTGDNQDANDTIVSVIKHLTNNAITLSPTFTEGFESATAATYNSPVMGFDGCDRCDFGSNSTNGRARTFVNTGFARTGNRAVTLDQKIFSLTPTADSLTTTFNLSGYTGADQLWLDFFYRNQGNDVPLPGNQVWIRGSDAGAWIPVFTLPTNDPSHFGNYRAAPPVNITETLANAVPAQAVTSSFQVKFGQHGFTSANNVVPNESNDDGFTFDDITITNSQNDVGIQALVSPALTNFCGLSATETVQVRVKNYSNITLNNIPVSYRVNGFTVNEIIPTLTAGQVHVFTFAQTANLAAFQQYIVDAWVNYPTDNYRNNDSLLNIIFHTTPTITSFPYLEGFEGGPANWYTGGIVSSWEWGTPAKSIISKAANGTRVWVTSLTGTHNSSEHSYLYSPCFNLTSMSLPVFSFSHIFLTEDDCDCDYHWVEYSLDDITWTRLGSITGGTNWYDDTATQSWQESNTNWHVSSYDVPVNAGKVRFRIVMSADPAFNLEGIGVDDVHIFDKSAIYTGADITGGLTQNVSGSNWIHFTTMAGTRVASINPNGQNLGNTEVKVYFNNTGSDRYSNVQYYLDRNIVIQPTIPPSGNVSVRFYFTDDEANNLMTATGCSYCTALIDPYEAGVTQYSNAPTEENGMLGDNASGLYNFIAPDQVLIAPYDNGYYAEYQVSNFSEFWINSGGPTQNRPLPMNLGSFTATKRNSTALLEWITLQEANTDRFIIEKSYDGSAYTAIGEAKAAGNSSISQRYRFTDAQLMNGANYYRLRLIDINGASTYSPVRVLNISGSEAIITLYPNPVRKGMLYINSSENIRRVDISDVTGRVLRSVSTQGNRQTVPLHTLSKGTYIITVVTDNGKKVEKLFVE